MIIEETLPGPPAVAGTPAQQEKPLETAKGKTESDIDLPRAGEPELPPAVPVSEISVQADDGPATSLTETIATTAAKVAPPPRGVSHDLPTPPLSEGGDDLESKEVSEPAKKVSESAKSFVPETTRSEGEPESVQVPGRGRFG
jgi:hypothetical protein